MSPLPTRLRPYWLVLKHSHRRLTLVLGVLFRRLSPVLGRRGVPVRATLRSEDTERTAIGATIHPGGGAERLVRGPTRGDPPAHWVLEESRSSDTPGRYVLEVAEGRLTGDFGASSTPDKVLDYQTSGYFGIQGWRQHPIYLRPTLGTVERVHGSVLSLAARGSSTNYYHFLLDSLARYGVFRECLPKRAVDAIVVPHESRYQRELLGLLGLDRYPLIQPRRGHTVVADRLLVPSTPNQELAAPGDAVRWLREHLAPAAPGPSRRVYVTRGRTLGNRVYLEEEALRPWLESVGFEVVDPASRSVQEQIDLFAGADLVVGPHGAGLTNILFCPPGARVVELFAASYVHLGLRNIAETRGDLRYHYLVADGDHRRGRSMTGNYDDVSIAPERVRLFLEPLLAES